MYISRETVLTVEGRKGGRSTGEAPQGVIRGPDPTNIWGYEYKIFVGREWDCYFKMYKRARESAIKLRDRMEPSATHLAVDIETSIMNILRSHFLSPARKEENI